MNPLKEVKLLRKDSVSEFKAGNFSHAGKLENKSFELEKTFKREIEHERNMNKIMVVIAVVVIVVLAYVFRSYLGF